MDKTNNRLGAKIKPILYLVETGEGACLKSQNLKYYLPQ
jgi:hypothetical protein